MRMRPIDVDKLKNQICEYTDDLELLEKIDKQANLCDVVEVEDMLKEKEVGSHKVNELKKQLKL